MNSKNNIFHNLFVLELANNHLGKLDRGLKIINDFSRVVRFNNIKAAIKLQFRDLYTLILKEINPIVILKKWRKQNLWNQILIRWLKK